MKIWGYVVFMITALGGVLSFWKAGKKAGANEATAETTKAALKQRDKANTAVVEGLHKETEARNAKPTTRKRDHFTRQ